jgi:hypothetical protein
MTGLEQDRKAIRAHLLASGWTVSDRGKFSDERAYLEYQTPSGLLLEVQEGTNEEADRFFFFYLAPGFGQGVHLNVHFRDDAAVRDRTVAFISEHKDDFSPETYKGLLRRLLKLGAEVLLDTEDELVPLADDEAIAST